MLLRSLTKHVTDQNWFAVFIDFLIVVVGVFIGIQVANWNADRQNITKEQVYLTRLNDELKVTIERLEGGSETFLTSVKALQLLLDSRNEYQKNPATYEADEDILKQAFENMTKGRVPASSPAVFEEMVANGELTLIRNTKLRQALYEFDEFANVSLHAWSTLRDQLLNAMKPTIGILIYRAKNTNELNLSSDRTVADKFDLERLLTQSDLTGVLSYALEAQANQLNLVLRHLELARAIQTQLNESIPD